LDETESQQPLIDLLQQRSLEFRMTSPRPVGRGGENVRGVLWVMYDLEEELQPTSKPSRIADSFTRASP
jgi:hypothetical protein